MKEKIVIIGANDFQNPLILKAKEKGYETHVFAWKENAIGEKSADFFYPVSIVEKDKILEICRSINPVGVCSIGSDLASVTVNYVASRLGLVANSDESILLSTNKYAMRQAFYKAGDPIPQFMEGDSMTKVVDVGINYPLIVKPTDRSGSRGVTKIKKEKELKPAIANALVDSFEKKVMIEEFVTGKEYSVEFISYRDMHVFLALTEKTTTGAPHFIETGHFQPAEVTQALKNKIINIVKKALTTLKIKNGASHSEVIVDAKEQVKIIEIGGRMGGDCIGSDLVPRSTGYDFVGMVIDIACGKIPDFNLIYDPKPTEIRFILNQKDLDCLETMRQNEPERIVFESPIDAIDERIITDSSVRYGFYIFSQKSKKQKEDQ
ncbi:MAG: ATP-grasp domain-containing protein [Eubacterium sp.]